MGLSPQNAALVERIFGKPVMLDEEGEDWNALLDAARSEATEAQARRIGELEDEVVWLQEGAKAFAAQVVEDVTQRAADVVLSQSKRIEALGAALTLVRMSRGWQYMADETKAVIDSALLPADTKEPSDDR